MKNLQPWEHSDFYDAYHEGNLIEDSFGLLRMADIVSQPSVIGASQFIFLPSSGGEHIVTLFYEEAVISVQVSVSPDRVQNDQKRHY